MQEKIRNKKDRLPVHVCVKYAAAAVFLMAFAGVYYKFSHGVHSPYMTFAFIWPLLGVGAAVWQMYAEKMVGEWSRVLLACGIATEVLGFLLQGIFEIAGTNSVFIPVFFAAGAGLLAAAVFFALRR